MNSRNGRLSFQAPSASKKEERKNYDFKKLDEDALGNVKMIL